MTDTTTLTLHDFLLARIAEDDAAARAAGGDHWYLQREGISTTIIDDSNGKPVVYDEGDPTREQAFHIGRWDPARVLAECAAKRAIVEGMEPYGPIDDLCAPEILGILAEPYSDHPDYREEWRPQ